MTEAAREDGGRQRLQVRLTRQVGVERRQTSGRLQQQRRSVVTAPFGEPHLCPQTLQPRTLQLVERADRRGRQQRGCGLRGGRLQLGLGGRERSPRSPGRIGSQRRRPL